MSVQIIIELPDTIFSALRSAPQDFVREMRIAAAVKWYEQGVLSQGKAAEVAGISRQEFIEALRFHVSPFQATTDELKEEMER